MTAEPDSAPEALIACYLRDYPAEAADELERLPRHERLALFSRQDLPVQAGLWEQLSPDTADSLLAELPGETAAALIPLLDPSLCARALGRLEPARRESLMASQDAALRSEFERLLSYPPDSAGHLMDLRPAALRGDPSVAEARQRLAQLRRRELRQIFLLDEQGQVRSVVDIQDLALAEPDARLSSLGQDLGAAAAAIDPSAQIIATLEQSGAEELPVLDVQNRLLGVIRARSLLRSARDNALADMQTMVGVSQDERALSPVGFAVRRRILWMHINLATAFLAAAVVGLFESTIAQFTALAVLLPVVAGQSGNAGAQALAVTMRGLALREISVRQWLRLLNKEFRVGLLNGLAVAASTSLGVYLWSRSSGLALIIGISMVLSMTIACIAGALVPVILTRLRQDPATSSSIVLTTVTDVAGFFSFLGIATLLSGLLSAG